MKIKSTLDFLSGTSTEENRNDDEFDFLSNELKTLSK